MLPQANFRPAIERGTQDSNLESPVLETGALPITPVPRRSHIRQPVDLPRRGVSADRRRCLAGNPDNGSRVPRRDISPTRFGRGPTPGLESDLARRLSPARAREEAPAAHRARRLATRDHARASARADPRAHSLGRLPHRQPLLRRPAGRWAKDVRVPALLLLQLSADIRAIFTEHCELLGIRWTLSNHRNVSNSHRRSVALLDEFVGDKA